jgi:hypothetical protein
MPHHGQLRVLLRARHSTPSRIARLRHTRHRAALPRRM